MFTNEMVPTVTYASPPPEVTLIFTIISIVCCLFSIASFIGMWNIFKKANEKSWKCLIPIYNLCLLYKIACGSGVWILLNLIPFVGSLAPLYCSYKLGVAFNKSIGFILGLMFLGPIFMIILGFDKSVYTGKNSSNGPQGPNGQSPQDLKARRAQMRAF